MGQWQLQEAKQQFSRLVDRAREDGPQVVTRHGREVAVVLDVDEYRRLCGEGADFKAFLMGPPYIDVELPVEHDGNPSRDVDL
jgi:antitoxin Phd